LYVEDDAVNALIMSALFEHRPGMRLVVAGSLAEALKQARDLHPVLLMLDLRLPDGDGRQLLPQLREIPGCETAPAVAVTAESGVELHGSGFAELWQKPLDLNHVLRKLDALADTARWLPQTPMARAGYARL